MRTRRAYQSRARLAFGAMEQVARVQEKPCDAARPIEARKNPRCGKGVSARIQRDRVDAPAPKRFATHDPFRTVTTDHKHVVALIFKHGRI